MAGLRYNERPGTTPVTLDRLFAHANAVTGIADTSPLSALASLFAGVAPLKVYADVPAMLAATDLPANYFAYVQDASADPRANVYGLYAFAGGDATNINSYYLLSTQPIIRRATATGLNNYAITVTPGGNLTQLGQQFQVKIPATSTGAVTLNTNGGGALKVFINPTTQAGADDLTADQIYLFLFDPALDSGAGGYSLIGGAGGGASDLAAVLAEGNDAGALQIKNAANATDPQDLTTLSQMNAAITAAVIGLLDYRGGFDASVNAYPSSGGSGSAGAILKGDLYVVTVAGTLPTAQDVTPGDWLIAKVDTPGNTEANWDIINVNVVVATDTVAGILKLYQATGANTDGAISQLVVTNALNLKSNRKWSITTKTGAYTLAAAELTALQSGVSLVMEGDNSGDLTIPANAAIAFDIGDNMAVRGFINIVAAGGVTVTGTNGTLAIPLGQTVVIEKTATNVWLLHNGGTTTPVQYWGTTTGTNTYAVTLAPVLAALASGVSIKVKFAIASTGASTLSPNGLTAKKIFKNPTTQAGNGDLLLNYIYDLTYDATLDSAAGGWLVTGGISAAGGGAWGTITGTLSAQTDLQNALNLKLDKTIVSNTPNMSVATSYTLQNSDCNGLVQMSKATAQDVLVPSVTTATIDLLKPILIVQTGAGQVTFNPDTGVTLLSVALRKKLFGQYSGAYLMRLSADTWLIQGDLVS